MHNECHFLFAPQRLHRNIFSLTSMINMNAPQHEPILRRPSTQGLEMRLSTASLALQRRLLARAENENSLVVSKGSRARSGRRTFPVTAVTVATVCNSLG
jgi:hypothetical protein